MRCLECGVDMKINGPDWHTVDRNKHWACYEVSCPISQANGRYGRYNNSSGTLSIGIRDDWWFAPYYRIPFRVDDDWMIIEAPTYPFIQLLTGEWINTRGVAGAQPHTSVLDSIGMELLDLPMYQALPQNEDFYSEWPKLKDYIEKCLLLI